MDLTLVRRMDDLGRIAIPKAIRQALGIDAGGEPMEFYVKDDMIILKKANLYPKIKFEYKETKKLKFKQLIDISFNKSKAKGYIHSRRLVLFRNIFRFGNERVL